MDLHLTAAQSTSEEKAAVSTLIIGRSRNPAGVKWPARDRKGGPRRFWWT